MKPRDRLKEVAVSAFNMFYLTECEKLDLSKLGSTIHIGELKDLVKMNGPVYRFVNEFVLKTINESKKSLSDSIIENTVHSLMTHFIQKIQNLINENNELGSSLKELRSFLEDSMKLNYKGMKLKVKALNIKFDNKKPGKSVGSLIHKNEQPSSGSSITSLLSLSSLSSTSPIEEKEEDREKILAAMDSRIKDDAGEIISAKPTSPNARFEKELQAKNMLSKVDPFAAIETSESFVNDMFCQETENKSIEDGVGIVFIKNYIERAISRPKGHPERIASSDACRAKVSAINCVFADYLEYLVANAQNKEDLFKDIKEFAKNIKSTGQTIKEMNKFLNELIAITSKKSPKIHTENLSHSRSGPKSPSTRKKTHQRFATFFSFSSQSKTLEEELYQEPTSPRIPQTKNQDEKEMNANEVLIKDLMDDLQITITQEGGSHIGAQAQIERDIRNIDNSEIFELFAFPMSQTGIIQFVQNYISLCIMSNNIQGFKPCKDEINQVLQVFVNYFISHSATEADLKAAKITVLSELKSATDLMKMCACISKFKGTQPILTPDEDTPLVFENNPMSSHVSILNPAVATLQDLLDEGTVPLPEETIKLTSNKRNSR